MRQLFAENSQDKDLLICLKQVLISGLFFCFFVSTTASAVTGIFPPTDPVPEIPDGAHLEGGDMIVWDTPVEAAPAGSYWTGGTVPYVFSTNVTATNQTRMINAMQQWENIANVNFRPFQAGDTSWLFIQDATGNSSYVGPQGGAQNVNIASWPTQAVIVHELGHALGDKHEQSRNDRDTYVTINFANVSTTACNGGDCSHNFDIDPNTASWLYSPYDYDSVLHYGATFFTTGGNTIDTDAPYNAQNISYVNQDIGPDGQCFTDDVPVGTWQVGIGQRSHMSHWDCRMMSFIYPQTNWRFVLPTRAGFIFQAGTFTLPWDTLADALATPSGGTVWIDGGTYSRVDINQPMTILAPKGTVTIQ